jgi:flagellar hook-associated protein 1 FlgK
MSLNSIMGSAVSGLQAAQTQLRAVSDNIANVDTPGYIRKVADQVSSVSGGIGTGVSISQVRLAADRFLQSAGLNATARAGAAAASTTLWDQAQGLFGDPSEDTSFFTTMDKVFSAFSTLSAAPTSTAARAAALDQAQTFFDSASSISDQLQTLRDQADANIQADVEKANQLLQQIDSLNIEISRAQIMGNDATAPQNQQSQLIDKLSTLMDLRISPRDQGGVVVRASDGFVLAGDGAATLSYKRMGASGELSIQRPDGQAQLMGARLTSGELKGFLDMRNEALPAVSNQLAELVSKTANQLNAVHNAYASVPPANVLTGRNTGLDLPTAISGFTGVTTIAVTDNSSVIQQRVEIDFDAGTMMVNGGPGTTPFTPANFLTQLNAALSPAASANFANGALSITGAGSNGVAIQDDAADPSLKAGRGFSAFFGLNDLVKSTAINNYDTGLKGTDPHGFTAGQQITFRLTGADGARLRDVQVTVPAATTMADLIAALNSPTTGVGGYGSFSLSANGQLAFAPPPGSGTTLEVVQDNTQRGATGPSMTALFGLGESARAARAPSFSIRPDIDLDPSKLSLARIDLTAGAGVAALAAGDTRGADELARAGQIAVGFDKAGQFGAITQKISDYAAALSGSIARQSEAAQTEADSADAVAAETSARRASVEGVNLDQELIALTTYQQAYSASARMITAVKEMYDVLLNMT